MRNISASVLTELANTVRPFIACEIEFSDQVLRLWTGFGSINLLPVDFAAPVVATSSGTITPVIPNGTYYCKIAILDSGGSPISFSGETVSMLIDTTHHASITVDPAKFPNGLRIYIGTTSGAENLYRDVNPVTLSTQHIDTGTFSYSNGNLPAGDAYAGIGDVASISPITETTDVQANGLQLGLSAISQGNLGEALSMCRQGLPITLRLGLLDVSGKIIADPCTLFVGKMDTVVIDEGADTASITVTAESRIIDLQRPRIRRYTDDDQQRTSPGDLGFQFVPMVQDWNGPWGLHDRGR